MGRHRPDRPGDRARTHVGKAGGRQGTERSSDSCGKGRGVGTACGPAPTRAVAGGNCDETRTNDSSAAAFWRAGLEAAEDAEGGGVGTACGPAPTRAVSGGNRGETRTNDAAAAAFWRAGLEAAEDTEGRGVGAACGPAPTRAVAGGEPRRDQNERCGRAAPRRSSGQAAERVRRTPRTGRHPVGPRPPPLPGPGTLDRCGKESPPPLARKGVRRCPFFPAGSRAPPSWPWCSR